jgi:ubiquinone/menaquinone biosynthesis C-methylase UbiE
MAHPSRDPGYLRTRAYRDASRLRARGDLHARFRTNPQGWFRWVFDQLDLPPSCLVLEVGCGPGDLWLDNINRMPPGWDVTLTDASPGMLREARARLGRRASRFRTAVADAETLPFADGKFDAVVACHVLFHTVDLDRAVRELRRVLTTGGRLFATTNGRAHMREIHEAIERFSGSPPRSSRSRLSFNLGTGADRLAPLFDDVRLARYHDRLAVTEIAPLMDYVLSMHQGEAMSSAARARFRRHFHGILRSDGVIHISKDSGMFAARAAGRTT